MNIERKYEMTLSPNQFISVFDFMGAFLQVLQKSKNLQSWFFETAKMVISGLGYLQITFHACALCNLHNHQHVSICLVMVLFVALLQRFAQS